MKILFLNIYQGKVDRGLETFVKEVSERLREKNEVDVIGAKKLPPARTRLPLIWRFYLDRNSLSILFFTFRTIPLILYKRYDVVVPTNGGWQTALVRLATWLYGGKMVVSGQAGLGWDDRNNLWCFPNVFVALSKKAQIWAQKANSKVKTIVIPNGVDINTFVETGKKFEVKLKKPIVLCVSALTKTKRVDLVINAVSKMRNASLLLVGNGELKQEVEQLGRRLLGPRFRLVKIPHERMPEVYRAADVFTLASEPFYAFEIVLTEAMACGLPVVANNDDIRKEIVGDAGLMVDPKDIEEYVNMLKKALNKDWGTKPRRQAEKFNWDMISKRYENLFNLLLK
jgi:glycosyltransferase involved in cell wall biosynthesis